MGLTRDIIINLGENFSDWIFSGGGEGRCSRLCAACNVYSIHIVGSILNKYTPFPSSRWGLYFGLEARHIFSCLAKTHNIFPSSNIYNPDNYSTPVAYNFSLLVKAESFSFPFFLPSFFLFSLHFSLVFSYFPYFFNQMGGFDGGGGGGAREGWFGFVLFLSKWNLFSLSIHVRLKNTS